MSASLLLSERSIHMGSPKKRLQYTYDSRGNRRSLVDPDGGRFTYAYDGMNRITQVQNPGGPHQLQL